MCDNTRCDECLIEADCKYKEGRFSPYCIRGFENIVSSVEQWSKEHPRKTRLQDLLEKFPNAIVSVDGKVAKACALELGYCDSCNYIRDGCRDCWNEPVE